LEHSTRKKFPTVTIIDGMIHLEAGGEILFKFSASQVVKVYCDVAFSLNFVPLTYSKGIIFRTNSQEMPEVKFYLNKLSVNKVTNIQSLVEYYQSAEKAKKINTIINPIVIEHKSLWIIVILAIVVLVAFWFYIGFISEKLLSCIGMCLFMIIPILLAHSNSLVKIEYKGKLHLTTFLGKQIAYSTNDILKADTQKATRAGENRVHYLNIYLKNGKHKKYKILLSSEEDIAMFHKLSERLMENTLFTNSAKTK